MAVLKKGVNDFKTLYPNLAKEWVSSEHNKLPDEVTCGSQELVSWKCSKCGSEWKNVVGERTRTPGCPFCKGRFVVAGVNDFKYWAINNNKTELLSEWNYVKNTILPDNIYYSSCKKVWWTCNSCKYDYLSSPNHRIRGRGCPKCAGNVFIPGVNDLVTFCNQKNKSFLLEEWNYVRNLISPDNVSYGSNKKVWWRCSKCGYNWETSVSNRARLNSNCPSCANVITVEGKNDLKTWCKTNNREYLLNEWDYDKNSSILGITPNMISAHNNKKVFWICPVCSKSWEASISTRVDGESLCPVCSYSGTSFSEQCIYFYIKQFFPNAVNRYTLDGIELDVYIPDISTAIEYDGIFWHSKTIDKDNEKDVFCKEHKIVLYRFREKSLPLTQYASTIFVKDKNTNELQNGIILLLSNLGFKGISIDINKDYDEITKYLYQSRTENTLLKRYPKLCEEWDYDKNSLGPDKYSWGTSKKVWWKCKKGHSYQMSINHRTNPNGNGCPICAGKVILPGYNDLKTWCQKNNRTLLIEEWDYRANKELTLEDFSYGSNKSVFWKCKFCGNKYEMVINKRTLFQRNCPNCSKLKIRSTNSKKIINTDTLQIFDSMTSAERTLGISHQNISLCCAGKKETAGGYHWSLLDDYYKSNK